MSQKKFTVLDLLKLDLQGHDALHLSCISGKQGLPREISIPNINRPGLALTGFFDAFSFQRVQVFGRGETAFLKKLHEEGNRKNLENFFSYEIPCCVFTYNFEPTEEFFVLAEKKLCPILQTPLESIDFANRLLRVLSNAFAPHMTMHGVLVEVYGTGVLLAGHSGVGKSETALELIERGHRLVADDVINIRCINGETLIAQGTNEMISHHMEIRGLGIINVAQLFGMSAIRNKQEVQMIIQLENWDANKNYDRLGSAEKTFEILGVKIPLIEIPVKPGRNLPVIIEAAVMNERLKMSGYDAAQTFNKNILKWIETGEAKTNANKNDDVY